MSAATRFCLVRHGETAWNVEKRLQGHADIPLNATGEAQAKAAAKLLAQQQFDAIYSSDLSRAMNTAQAAAHYLGLPVQAEPQLRERHCGVFQGLPQDVARDSYQDEYARYRQRDPEFVIPGGESLEQLCTRISTCLERLADHHAGETVLVVSHGGVLDIAHRLATGKPLDLQRDFAISNAALNWIERDEQGWKLLVWDQKDHLNDALDELPG